MLVPLLDEVSIKTHHHPRVKLQECAIEEDPLVNFDQQVTVNLEQGNLDLVLNIWMKNPSAVRLSGMEIWMKNPTQLDLPQKYLRKSPPNLEIKIFITSSNLKTTRNESSTNRIRFIFMEKVNMDKVIIHVQVNID